MTDILVMMGFLIFWVVMAVIVALIAASKGRNVLVWVIYGLIFWPLALAHILVTPGRGKGQEGQAANQDAAAAAKGKEPKKPKGATPKIIADGLARRFRIVYQAIDGELTDRTITLHKVYEREKERYIRAYCHKVRSERSFQVSRISELEDLESGQQVEDPASFIDRVAKGKA